MFRYHAGQPHPVRSFLSGTCMGILSVLILYGITSYWDLELVLNPLTGGTALILGIPGVLTMLTLGILL
ncbi:MAG TPA: pro-sigmaK processing inhibitor BofA family protein [Firmicutes bacterium]|nr:pro-sigmaK processing inhibitor BofA family protein [Bacillota bacterium]